MVQPVAGESTGAGALAGRTAGAVWDVSISRRSLVSAIETHVRRNARTPRCKVDPGMAEVLPQSDLIDDESELAAERLTRGTRLGRYELLIPIAKGGMARVWAARQHGQRGFTKLVAIKTILPHLARDAEFERMFLDEARIASMVHHPNVCEIYELGEEGRVLYLAMEWVMGESLAHMLRSGGKPTPLDVRVVARIISDACAGLNAAHNTNDEEGRALGIVHRDVSPHNILVNENGHVK